MTTVAQMIEWMKTLPQEAEVHCGMEMTKGYSTWNTMAPVDIGECTVSDYTSESDRKQHPHMAGRIIVDIRAD